MPKKILKLFLLLTLTSKVFAQSPPKLTVVFIIDQFAYWHLDRVSKHLNDGLKKLLDNGLFYTSAYFPHAQPGTAPGHACLGTGTLPKTHGIVSNFWFDKDGKKVNCYDDAASPVLSPDGTYNYGKSSRNRMVPGFDKSFVSPTRKLFALSIKNRAAIGVAGKYGKAIWLDKFTGGFTSSKAYFPAQPDWLKKFNRKNKLTKDKAIYWQLAYPSSSPVYNFPYIRNYEFTAEKTGIAEKFVKTFDPIKGKINKQIKRTPRANQVLLNCAKKCLDNNFSNKDDKFVLFISMSSLDKAGHYQGPQSLEATDLIYHFDKQIGDFMRNLEKKHPDVLYILTADHGVTHIPELLAKQGKKAKRIYTPPLQEKMNADIKKQFGVEKIVTNFNNPSFYLDTKKLNAMSKAVQAAILDTLKQFLLSQDGIKRVWTFDELEKATFSPDATEKLFQNQLFRGRTGQIICMGEPLVLITNYPNGTDHITPYEDDRHVPLVFYRKGHLEKRRIETEVNMVQFAPTLASLLGVPKPPASVYSPIPTS